MFDLEQTIRERHSPRLFLSRPVPRGLVEEAQRRPPNIPPLPESFKHFRSELGAQVYGAMGITREDKAGHTAAVLRNWEFFRAPLAGIICMHKDLVPADALSVGMFLQTLLLALTARGLGTCVEVSIAGYAEIVRAQLAIPAELSILCGLAVGYPDPDFAANKLHVAREPIGKSVRISSRSPRIFAQELGYRRPSVHRRTVPSRRAQWSRLKAHL